MPTVVETPGAANANSYLSVAEADAYFDTRLAATVWTGSTTTIKQTALIMATRLMDKLWDWVSIRTDTIQYLDWPRIGVLAENRLETIDDDVIPQALKEATAEFAMQLISEDRTLDSDIETLRINALKAGSVSLTFGNGVKAKVVPDAVFYLIPEWWGSIRSRRGRTVRLSRA